MSLMRLSEHQRAKHVSLSSCHSGPTANLGCGTLILIAIIVAMFSSRGTESVARLEQEVRALEKKIDGLGTRIEKLLPPAQRGDPQDRAP